MQHLGIQVNVKNVPELDRGFIPLLQFDRAFLAGAKQPLDIAVERSGGQVAVFRTKIHATADMAQADLEREYKDLNDEFAQFENSRKYITDDSVKRELNDKYEAARIQVEKLQQELNNQKHKKCCRDSQASQRD